MLNSDVRHSDARQNLRLYFADTSTMFLSRQRAAITKIEWSACCPTANKQPTAAARREGNTSGDGGNKLVRPAR